MSPLFIRPATLSDSQGEIEIGAEFTNLNFSLSSIEIL